jgi:predicted amidohydrolase YtcJ
VVEADVALVGGRVFTAGMTASRRGDVALSGGRIAAVGDPDDIRGVVGPATEIVDVSGSLVLPGFQDAHAHPIVAGVELLRCDLTGATSADECLALIAAYAATTSDPWILGGGWSMDFFEGGAPRADDLDRVVGDRPVLLNSRDHHSAWVNSRALQLAGVDAGTPDPSDGRIERDAAGAPTGTLHEGAVALVERFAPATDAALTHRALLRAQEHLFSFGITGWQDAMVGAVHGFPDTLQTYLSALDDGSLVARVVGAQWWRRDADAAQIAEILERRDRVAARGRADRLRLDTVKIMVDGITENFTAALSLPYRDAHGHTTDNAGLSFIDPAQLREIVVALDREGLQVHFHALGDRAVTEALDAVEAARAANGPDGARHHLAHLQVVAASDVPRFARNGAAANLQALWACHERQLDELTLPFLDPALVERHYPFGELHRAGTRLVAGSDWPVSTPDPLAAVHVAVNRIAPDADTAPLGRGQELDLATALSAYTAGSAWINGRETTTGALVPGAAADLAVLDRDPFEGDAGRIADARVTSTWIDGIRVYERPAA